MKFALGIVGALMVANFSLATTCPHPVDLVFLLDSSESLRTSGFYDAKTFVQNVVNYFTLGPDDTRVGVVTYSNMDAQVTRIKLNDNYTRVELLTGIRNIPYDRGHTFTGLGLDHVRNYSFLEENGGRNSTLDFLIVITDDESEDDIRLSAQLVRDMGITVFVVAIGEESDISQATLETITGDPRRVFRLTDHDFLVDDSHPRTIREAICDATQCPALTAPANGVLSTTATSYQTVVNFTCNTGYVLNGAVTATCQADITWSNPVPTCTPIQCPILTAPANGALSTTATSYQIVVTFTCNTGYVLNGTTNTTCQSDGTWSNPVPTCTRTTCSYPVDLVFLLESSQSWRTSGFEDAKSFVQNVVNYFTLGENDTRVGVVTFSNMDAQVTRIKLNENYTRVELLQEIRNIPYDRGLTFTGLGLDHVRNYSFLEEYGGRKNTLDFLIVITDDESEDSVGGPAQLVRDMGITVFVVGVGEESDISQANLEAIAGDPSRVFRMTDHDFLVQDAQVAPIRESICNAANLCEPHPCDNNATCRLLGSTFECSCDVGLVGDGFNCSVVQCHVLTAPVNGALSPTGRRQYQDVVTFTCNPGYSLVGTASLTCLLNGTWSASPPTCNPRQCPTLNAPANGVTFYQTVVGFTCNAGYVLNGAAAATCQADGTWSNTVPTCTLVVCPARAAPANGAVSPTGAVPYPNGVTFTCNTGYTLNGFAFATCRVDGTWSSPVPTCAPIQCPPRTAPANGVVSPTGAVSYPNGVTFNCNPGYVLNGAATATCKADGTWSNPVPTCQVVKCPARPAPANGAVSPTGPVSYPNGVTFTCNTGYILNGAVDTTCTADGTWGNPVPTCTAAELECPARPAPANGAVSPTGPVSYPNGVTFTCNPGYTLNGAASPTCQADGTWSSPVPTCAPIQCPPRTAPANGAVSPTGPVSYPNGVTFTCNSGYTLNGVATPTCQADGTWSNPVPTCAPILCPPRTAPANGVVFPTGPVIYEEGVEFSCDQGYVLNGAATATCTADGAWSHPVPTCSRRQLQCETLTAPANGALSTTATSYQTVVNFTCNTGYVLNGTTNTTCQADRTWSNSVPTCTLDRIKVSICPPEIEDLVVGETVSITCNTTRLPGDYNYQWTVDGAVVPNQGGPVFRYGAVSGVHKIKCKVTSSSEEMESEDSTVTVLPEGTLTFVSSIRITARDFTPEMADPCSAAFKSISQEIEDWYQQAASSVQGQISIRVKDVKPGSVITTQNVNVQDSVLQEKDLYNRIYNGLRSAAQTPDPLGVDPESVTLLSATTCYGETVTVRNSSSDRVSLTFPSSAADKHVYSTQRCANNTESAGVPLAVRRCMGTFQTGVSWASPEMFLCKVNLSKLAQVPVTSDNVAQVAADLQILTSVGRSLTAENITDTATVLENIVNTGGDEDVGYSFVVSVDQMMNADDGVLYQSQLKDQAPSRIVQALEQFNDRVNLTNNRFRRIEPNIGVETYMIGALELMDSVGFASLEGGEDLEDGMVQSYSDSSFIPNDEVDASISLFEELRSVVAFLNENLIDPTDVEVRLSFTIYQNSRLFQSNQTASSSTGTNTRVNSRVIASRVTGFQLENLPNSVVTRFLPIVENSTNTTVNNIRCVFWDFNAGGGGAWSTEGCDFARIDHSRVVCECNHLTNFAVLVDIYGGLHSFTLDLISKIGIALSIPSLALTLITYLAFKQLRQTRPHRILINLCLALLATLIIFLSGISATSSPVGCTVVAFFLHYFLLAVFMWMAVEAFNMYLAFVKVLGAYVSKFLLKAAILAWGLPFVIAIITLVADVPSTYPDGHETYRSNRFCWLQGNQLYFGFLLPAGLILLFNTIVYIMVISKLTCRDRNKGKVSDPKKGGTKQQLRIAITVMVLVGLTWIFGFFMINDGRVVFSYLFCIFNSLQGFFIFFFQCVRQKEVQDLWFNCWGCPVDKYRTAKSLEGKPSADRSESDAEGYTRGQRKRGALETVAVKIPMSSM
ncbi:uncharacterized protein LOC144908582 isoform X2 [Branchiostoma floridae x Branchiostoma belcheri]